MSRRGYLRSPHVAGDLLAFASGEELWLAPAEGGTAWRFPPGGGGAQPRLSPDGSSLAWVGGQEVWVAHADGSAPRRLTYWGDPHVRLHGWFGDGGALLASSATGQPDPRSLWAHRIPLGDGPPGRLPYGPAGSIACGETITALIGDQALADPAKWKRYRGGGTGRLWISLENGPFQRILAGHPGAIASVMLVDERVAFISDHEGCGNLYSCLPDGADLRRHTDHTRFYARAATSDGTRIVYQHAGDIWLLESLNDVSRPIAVDLPGSTRRPRTITTRDGIDDVALDRTGDACLVEIAETVHRVDLRGRATPLADGARLARFAGDDAVWVTRQDGLDVLVADGRPRCAPGELGRISEVVTAPDGRSVAVASAHGRLTLVEIGSGAHTRVTSIVGAIGSVAYSPDSRWLTWSEVHRHRGSRVRLARLGAAVEQVFDVTDGSRYDLDPCFTPDGRFLALLSFRDFRPVYDQQVLGLSFPLGCRPYLVPLDGGTPSPFAGWGRSHTPVAETGAPGPLIQVPVPEAIYTCLRPVADGLVWLRTGIGDRAGPTLERFSLTSHDTSELATDVRAFAVSGDGLRLATRDRTSVEVLSLRSGADPVRPDLSGIEAKVDQGTRRRWALEQARRIVPEEYWAEGMAGLDWDAVVAAYEPLVERLAGPSDFSDLLWEVNGELGCSHAYVRPATRGRPGRAAWLGADLTVDGAGQWRVSDILPGDPGGARSPLDAPGLGVSVGDVITTVDGTPVDPARGPLALLAGKAGRAVRITLGSGAAIEVFPLAEEFPLRYRRWLARQRAVVAELSGGRAGYLHVPDTEPEGWADLHRDLLAQLDHEALIVDLRGNRGGHASPLLLDRLRRRILAWDRPRHTAHVSYPPQAPRGPLVALADHRTFSDGDLTTAAIRLLGLGPVVGTRTWGGVIGLDRFHRLVDGTEISVPSRPFWFEEWGLSLENRGVEPDVEVVISPDDWAKDADPQLDVAVRLCVDALNRRHDG
ncbi:S41 family peptidase [Nonomuraea purpurea]|uniref:S41 family peptidase n=1 Tax=Nonomuraea purpurea TaxID=1849276 RepID=A0ABV8G7Z6_9ACTN